MRHRKRTAAGLAVPHVKCPTLWLDPDVSVKCMKIRENRAYMFMGQPCATLVVLDSWTRYAQALPLQGKTVSKKKLAEDVVKFSLRLNYVQENVHFAMDAEPATKALLDLVVAIRRKMGYKATTREGKPYHKGRPARVERHIQHLRRQCLALIEMVENRIAEKIP